MKDTLDRLETAKLNTYTIRERTKDAASRCSPSQVRVKTQVPFTRINGAKSERRDNYTHTHRT